MSTAKACLRRHFYRYEMGLVRDRESQPLRMGSAVHLGLDMRAKGVSFEEACLVATDGYQLVPQWSTAEEWETERTTVARLLHGYYWRYEADEIDALVTEQAFDLPLVNPATGRSSRNWRLAGKIDKVVRLADGRLAIMEHKTTGDSIDSASDYWTRLKLDQQISLYVLAARALGHDVQTVLYDVIRKPEISPRQVPLRDADGLKIVLDQSGERVFNKNGKPRESASTADGWKLSTRTETPDEFGDRLTDDIGARPDFYFQRREIPRLEKDLEEFRYELWQQAHQLRDCQLIGRWFRNTNSCLVPYKCEFLDLCSNGFDHGCGAIPEGFKRLTEVHPELHDATKNEVVPEVQHDEEGVPVLLSQG